MVFCRRAARLLALDFSSSRMMRRRASSPRCFFAARRIAFGRWFNAGQTCTAPDYVLVFRDVRDEFLKCLKETLLEFYGEDPQKSPDYGRIVILNHFDRLGKLLARR